ncbi:MAG TPA: hypothetical protein VN578_17385 [Candidatus Binatia bacterium]|jgi:hypothetical protein|nr:hypothetical protein [Candidatus Binatia bacterium]
MKPTTRPALIQFVLFASLMIFFSAAQAAGPVTQFIWATQPDLATNGLNFAQNPVLRTADATGTPSTVGLPAVKIVQVALYSGSGALTGILTTNIGTAGGNGTVTFPILQLSAAGAAQLIALDAGAGIYPTNITAGSSCQLWLDAADLSTLQLDSDGLSVTNWLDKSGKSNNASNTTPGQAPVMAIDGSLSPINAGRGRVLTFNGTSDSLNMNLSSLSGSPYTVIAMEVWAGKANSYIIGNDGPGATDLNLHIGYQSGTDWKWGQYGDDMDFTGTTFSPSTPLISTEVMNSSRLETLYFNSVSNFSRTANGLLSPSNLGNGRIGRAQNGNPYQGDIAEVMVFNTALSGLDRTNLENYLSAKWVAGLAIPGAISASFTVQPSPITSLVFVNPNINNAVQGTAITAGALGEVQVQALGASSGPIPGATVMLAIASGNGAIVGNSAVTDGSGIAHFTNLRIDKIGAKTLQASSSGILSAASGSFLITASAPAFVTVETAADGSGVILPTQNIPADLATNVFAISRDAATNFVANVAATWSLVNVTGGVVNGDLVVAGDTKSATFTGHFGGSARIQAVAAFTGQSGVQTVVGGAAVALSISRQPSAAAAVAIVFPKQPIITVLDQYGNTVLSPAVDISVTSVGSLGGTTTLTTVNGVARFTDLAFSSTGTFQITFSSGSLPSTNSRNIVVSQGNATGLAWATQPGLATNGLVFGQSPVLVTTNAYGEVTAAGLPDVKMVRVELYSGSGVLTGTITTNIGAAGGNGTVTFADLQLSAAGTAQIVAYDMGNGLTPTTITAASNCQLWLDAFDVSTILKSGTSLNVTNWMDKSGKGNNAVNTTLSQAPLAATNAALALAARGIGRTLHFDGANARLAMSLSSLSGSPFTVIIMDVAADKGASSSYLLGNDNGGGTRQTLHIGYNNDSSFKFALFGDDLNWAPGYAFLPPIVPHLWTMKLDTNRVQTLYLNSAQSSTRTAGGFLTGTGLSSGRVGRANGGNQYLGDIAEVVVFNTALSDTDRQNLEDYLSVKWITGLSRAISTPFTVQPSPITLVTFVNPSINNAVQGTAITAGALGEVQVSASAAGGGPVPGATVTLAIASGNGTILGNSAVTDAGGIAHFTNLRIDKIGTKTLQASSSGIQSAASGSFIITASAPAFVMVETAADGSGVILPTQNIPADLATNLFAISRDSANNFIANVAATWSLVNVTGGVANGDLVVAGDTKSATFTGHFGGTARIQAVGTFTGQSGVQTVVGGAATYLAMNQQPSTTAAVGAPFAIQPIVSLRDHYGNTVLNSSTVITASETSGGSLNAGGVTPVTTTTANGVATFSGLFVTNTGTVTLTFTSGSLTPTNSGNIAVSVGNVAQVVWVTQPGLATNGIVFGQSPVIKTADAGGYITVNGLPPVKIVQVALYSGSGILSGILTTNIGTTGGNGTVTLPNLQITTGGTAQLIATDIGLGFNPTNIISGNGCQMWFDAADLSTITIAGTNVISWLDKSGKVNNADTNNRAGGVYVGPTFATNSTLVSKLVGLNGLGRALRFNGNNSALGMNMSALSNSPYTVIVMEVATGKSGTAYFFGNNGAGATRQVLHIGYQSTTAWKWGMFGDDMDFTTTLTPFPQARLSTEKLTATTYGETLYYNGAQVNTRTAGGYLQNGAFVQGSVGRANNGNNYLGDIAEVVAYNIDLSDTDRTNVEDYLTTKWKTGLRSSLSAPFLVNTLPLSSLVFVNSNINNTVAGNPITAAALGDVQVKALSSQGITIPGVTVAISIASGTGTISGNSAVTDNSGIAHFTTLSINQIGTKVLQASSLAVQSPVSSSFLITAQAASALALESAADGSGTAIPDEILPADLPLHVFAISRDIFGNFIGNVAATWSLVNLSGGVNSGDLVASGDSKSATFTGHLVGSAQIQAAAALTGISGVQTVVAGAPAYLVINQQPSATAAVGAPFDQQPIVAVFDHYGNTAFSNVVVMATETSGGLLNATPTPVPQQVDANGVATFSGLFVTNTGIVTLRFTAGSISTNSDNIVVSVGNVARVVWVTQPPATARAGQIFSRSPVLQTADAGGHLTVNGLTPVRLIQVDTYSGAGVLMGTLSTNIGTAGGNGTVTLPDLQITQPGTYQIIALDGGEGVYPTNITDAASCQLWLDAADLNTLTLNGTNVTTWMDKSGKGHNATGGVSPSIGIDSILSPITAGRGKVVRFDGVNTYLGTDLSSLYASPYTIIAIEVATRKDTGSSYFIGNQAPNGSAANETVLHVGYYTPNVWRWGQYGDDLDSPRTDFVFPAPRISTMEIDASRLENLYFNSQLVNSRTASSFLLGQNLGLGTIGAALNGNNYLGDLAEIMVFNAALPDQDRAALEQYLSDKWATGWPGAISASINVWPIYTVITSISYTSSNVTLTAVYGPPSGTYRVLGSTDVTAPFPQGWTQVATGSFDAGGNCTVNIPVNPAHPVSFYRLSVP